MSGQPPVLAADLGGTHLRIATFDGERLGPVTAIAHGGSAAQPLAVEQIGQWLHDAIGDQLVAAAGISVAGTVEREEGIVLLADNLGWTDVPLTDALAARLGIPVRIDTDTFCGAMAEARFGGAGTGTVLSIAIGTGIGHAWIFDGAVWRGAQDAAAMIGHLVIDSAGPRCYCGGRGCLCQYAAGPIVRAALDHGDEPALTRATDALAIAIAHALTLVNPDDVVLGGGAVSDAWPNLGMLGNRVVTLLHRQVRPIQIRRSTLGDRANLLGAGLLGVGLASGELAACGDTPHPQPFSPRGGEKCASREPGWQYEAPLPAPTGEGLG